VLENHPLFVQTGKSYKRLPYYFCETCGKVYLTQDEFIAHHSSVHDKAPQQPQSSQLSDLADNLSDQQTAPGDGNSSVVDPGTYDIEISARKNSSEGEIDHKKRKVGSVLLLHNFANVLLP